jgi:hypothetical protein
MREFFIYIKIFLIYIRIFFNRIWDIILYDILKKRRDENLFGFRCYRMPTTNKHCKEWLLSIGANLDEHIIYRGCILNKEAIKRVKFKEENNE